MKPLFIVKQGVMNFILIELTKGNHRKRTAGKPAVFDLLNPRRKIYTKAITPSR